MNCVSSRTSWRAKECEVGRPCHVRGGHERADESDNHERVVTVVTNIVDDFVLGEETRKWEYATQRQGGNNPRGECDRHVFAQSTHVAFHVEGVMGGTMTHRTGAEKQACLEKCVSKDVKYRRHPRPAPKPSIM